MRAGLLALLLVACKADPTANLECVDDGDCEGLAVCGADNTCRTVECLDSSQCAVGNHCNEESHTCFTGCVEDADCMVGQVCDTETTQCVQGACTDANVDCYIGQSCFEDGTCGRRPGLCLPCTGAGYSECTQTYGGTCAYSYTVYVCLLPCDPTALAAPPREFTCSDISYDHSGEYYWVGDCAISNDTAPDP